ncbi:hypothetical protein CK203_043426 [Vitis vinifera]|uniref:Uncharacterized protein n=1 Tax=Vitis vinifera TaxID=29760 RepID=A0A438IAM8_VITVI|nr:hypothetical protein CK203_043426 [Vitis vinifera]
MRCPPCMEAPRLLRRAEGCVPLEDPSIRTSLHVGASEGLQSLFSYSSDPVFPLFSLQLRVLGDRHLAVDTFVTLEFSSNIQISDCHLRTIQFRSRLSLESHSWRRVGGRLIRADSYPSSDSSVEMSDELASTLASIQEFMAGVSRRLDQIESSRQDPHPAGMVTDETIPHASQTAADSSTWGFTCAPPMVPTIEDTRLAEQEAKVERLESMMRQIRLQDGDIERYSGIGCPKIHLRLYSTVMRAHGIDDAQLVALFLCHLVGQLRDGLLQLSLRDSAPGRMAREFLTQFAFSAILMYPDESWRPLGKARESISSFVTRWRARWLKRLWLEDYGQILLLPLTASCSQSSFPSSRWYQYQPDYVQEPYIAQTSMQPRPSHPRATTHPPPRPYAQRPVRQFTPLGMTLTRAFKKLRDAGVIVPLAPRPLPHPIPPHFRLDRFRDEDLGQSAWVHHLVAVQFKAFLILIMRTLTVIIEHQWELSHDFRGVTMTMLDGMPVFSIGHVRSRKHDV